jgi:hypothetical protein
MINSSKKVYYLLIVIFMIVISSIFAMLYFSKNFMSNSEQELIAAKLEIIKQEQIESIYRQNIKDLEEFSDTANILSQIIPTEKDQAKAVREIDAIARLNGLVINTLSFPSSDLNKKPSATTPAAEGAPAPAAAPTVSQAKPVKGLNGVLGIDINVELRSVNEQPITTDQLLGLLRQIENNRRNMRVTSINFNAGDQTVVIKLIIFIKP